MTEPVTITCVVEFDGTRDEYSVEFTGEENRSVAEAALRRMVAEKVDPAGKELLSAALEFHAWTDRASRAAKFCDGGTVI